jgi:hypothetical protein
MRSLVIAAVAHIALVSSVVAGRPIILEEAEACAGADLVVIATIAAAKDVPATPDDPFVDPFVKGASKWHNLGFTKFAQVEVERTLIGNAPDELWIYGGKLGLGTDFRIAEGQYLLLLKQVKDDAYRAVDWNYSFVPIKDGKVGWLIDRFTDKRQWISAEEAIRLIMANQEKDKANKAEMATPSKPSD